MGVLFVSELMIIVAYYSLKSMKYTNLGRGVPTNNIVLNKKLLNKKKIDLLS